MPLFFYRLKRSSSVLSLLFFSALLTHAQSLPAPLSGSTGYQMVFHDEFDSLNLSPTGTGSFTWYDGVWFNHQRAPLANISVSNSILTLLWTAGQPSTDTSITTLSRDKTRYHAWRYGYFEARLRWDVVTGAWPAFWMIPVQDAIGTDIYSGQKESGEIDIFEGQGDQPYTYFATIHDWLNLKDTANLNNVVKLSPSVDMSQFHTYGILWVPGQMTWYLDGVAIHSEIAPPIFDIQDFFVVLGMQEGAAWKAGNMTGVTATSMKMDVDWFRVWQKP
jgi:beta-glucanase (GH16 family)